MDRFGQAGWSKDITHDMQRTDALFALICLLMVGCGQGQSDTVAAIEAPPRAFATARVCILTSTDALILPVEVAADEAERARGLMGRAHLPANAGMLFVYPETQPPENGFWMFRTHLPLDIAFIDSESLILSIQTMRPCQSLNPQRCPSYYADAPYQTALEVNAGFFASHGIESGDRVIMVEHDRCPRGEHLLEGTQHGVQARKRPG